MIRFVLICIVALSVLHRPAAAQFDPDRPTRSDFAASGDALRPLLVRLERETTRAAKDGSLDHERVASLSTALLDQLAFYQDDLERLAAEAQSPALQERFDAERDRLHALQQVLQPLEHADGVRKQLGAGQADQRAALSSRLKAALARLPHAAVTQAPRPWGSEPALAALPLRKANPVRPVNQPAAEKRKGHLLELLPLAARETPVALLRYLETNLTYTPYWGGFKPPQAVLSERAGNDADINRLLAELLIDMDVPAKLVHGRVFYPSDRLFALLRVADSGAAANVLRAARIPHEAVFEDDTVTGFRLERVWIEAYLPISDYRGAGAGSGEHAWLPLDAATAAIGLPEDDAFADVALDSRVLLEAFEQAGESEAAVWLNQELAQRSGRPLAELSAATAPTAGPELLELSLPYREETVFGTFTTLPDHLRHRIRLQLSDAAGLVALSGESFVDDLYGVSLIRDAVPAGVADEELVTLYGNRWDVPANLLQLRPVYLRDGYPLFRANRAFRPGTPLLQTVELMPVSGETLHSENAVINGGYEALALHAGGALLNPNTVAWPTDITPFGNAAAELGRAFLDQSSRRTLELATALGMAVVTPSADLARVYLDHQVTFLDGSPVALDLAGIRLDADQRHAALVRRNSALPDTRPIHAHRLTGLIAAAEEGAALARLGIEAVGVPELFQQAVAQGLEPIDVAAGQALPAGLDQLPPAFRDQLTTALNAGYRVRFLPVTRLLAERPATILYLEDPDSGRSNWLLDFHDAGAATSTPPSAWPANTQSAAAYPEVDTRIFADDEVAFIRLDPNSYFQTTNADSPGVDINIQALNSLGRPIAGAELVLFLQQPTPGSLASEREVRVVTGNNGWVSARFPVPILTTWNPFLTKLIPDSTYNDLVGLYSIRIAAIEHPVEAVRPAVLQVNPGFIRGIRVFDKNGIDIQNSWVTAYINQELYIFPVPVDGFANPIANRRVTLQSGFHVQADQCDTYGPFFEAVMVEAGLEPRPYSATFYEAGQADARQTSIQWNSRIFGPGLFAKPGAKINVLAFLDVDIDADGQRDGGFPMLNHDFIQLTSPGLNPNANFRIVSMNIDPLSVIDPNFEPEADKPGDMFINYRVSCDTSALPYPELPDRDEGYWDVCGLMFDKPIWPVNGDEISDHREVCLDIEFGTAEDRFEQRDLNGLPSRLFRLPEIPDPNVPNPTIQREFDIPVDVFKTVIVQDGFLEGPPFHCGFAVECPVYYEAFPADQQELRPGFLRLWQDGTTSRLPYNVYERGPGQFGLEFEVNQPGVVEGLFNYYRLIIATGPDHFGEFETQSLDQSFAFVVYAAAFDQDINIDIDERRRQVSAVEVSPDIRPAGLPFYQRWTYDLIADGIVVDSFSGLGDPTIRFNTGNLWDPDKTYRLRFAYMVNEDGSLDAEGFTDTVAINVQPTGDLSVIDIEEHALWLDRLPPDGAKRNAGCDGFNDGLFRAWPVYTQKFTYSHLDDYRDVVLTIAEPTRLSDPNFQMILDGTPTSQQDLAEAYLPRAFNQPFVFPNRNVLDGGDLIWQLVGSNTNAGGEAKAGRPRSLPFVFPLAGAGVIGDSGGFRTATFDPDYRYTLVEDPTGLESDACLNVERRLGFQLNLPARVTFTYDGEVLAEDQPYGIGIHSFDINTQQLGRREWTMEATFQTGQGDSVVLRRNGSLTIDKQVRKSLNIGATAVKGVNLTSGSLSLGHTDLAVPGYNGGLAFTRSYNSAAGQNYNPLGIGWSHNWQTRLVESGCNGLTIVGSDGSGQVFALDERTSTYVPAMPGVYSRLETNNYSGYTLITKSGRRFIYGPPLPRSVASAANPHDFRQNLIAIEDTFGNRTTLVYDDFNHQIREVVDPSGRKLLFEYDESGLYPQLTQVTTDQINPAITLTFSYDDFGHLVQVARGERVDTYAYNEPCQDNRLAAYTNANGQTTTYTYHEGNAVPGTAWIAAINQPEGVTTRFNYLENTSAGTLRVTVSDDLATTVYHFNADLLPVLIENPMGTKTLNWKPNDVVLASEIDEAGRTTIYTYDDYGNLLATDGTGDITESWQFDTTWHKALAHTDPRGNTTTWQLNPATGAVVVMTNALGDKMTFTYDDRGNLVEREDFNGNKTSWSHDAFGYIESQVLPDGNTIAYQFDGRGRMIRRQDGTGRITTLSYTDLDYLVQEQTLAERSGGRTLRFTGYTPLGQPSQRHDGTLVVTYTYDQLNRVTQVIETPGQNQPAVTRDLAYDIHGNLTRETTSGGGAEQRVTIHTYDPADRLTQATRNGRVIQALEYLPGTDMVTHATDWKGAVTELQYDNTLRLEQVVLPTGHVKTFRHDKAGNRISETDGNGQLMQWQYDDLNRVVLQTNPLGHATRYEYDANGNPLTRRNLVTGAGLSQQFDEVNRVTEQRVFNSSSGDQITRFAYQHFGRIVVETPPLDAAVTHTGNELGQLISREQAGITVGYTYDANGNIERVDHPMGFTTTRVNDGYGRLVTENAPLGYTQSAEYDIYGNTVRHTDPRGIVTTTVFDLFDRPTQRTSTHETGSAEESWTYAESLGVVTSTYTDARGNTQTQVSDPLGRLTSFSDSTRAATATQVWDAVNLRQAVDMRGFTTTYTYDPLNRVLTQTDDGGTVSMAYDDAARTVTATDRRGISSIVVHDETGNTLTTTRAGLTLVTTSYDRQNRSIRAVDGSGIVNTRGFDNLGRPTFEAVGPQRNEYRNYDDLGRPHEVYDGRTSVTFDYDFYDRIVTQTNGEGETTRLSYDPAGNVLTATRPAPHGGEAVTQYTYDLVNTLTQVIEPNGAETNYLWTNQWRLLTATDAEGEVCTWNFDNAGRLASVTMPGLGTTSFGYDAHDNRTGMTQPIGAVTYTYDYLNRLLDETWLGNAHATAAIDSITRIRDANGNLTDVTQTGSEGVYSRTIGYDNLDRPTSFGDSRGFNVGIEYNVNGTRRSVTDADGLRVDYTYDAANRLENATVAGMGTVRYAYTNNSLIDTVELPNGTTCRYGYDNANRPTSLDHSYADNRATNFTATYYPDGSRESLTEDRGALGLWHTDYQYDQNSRLTAYTRSTPTSTRTTTFTLDLVGNRTAEQEQGEGYLRDRVYTLTDAGHRISHFTETVTENDTLTLDRVVSYTYDANGNRLSKTSADQVGKRAVSLTMIWDARNRLRRVDQDGIAALHFDYDDLDRRIRKAGDSREADPILYVWDELAVLTELREGAGGNEPTTIASYAFGLTRLALKRVGTGNQWFHHDMLGSIADLSDASGTVVEAKTFTPYGKQETITTTAEGNFNRYGYTGHEYDEETDLTYAKARFYDQDLGIFASADPVLGQFDRPPSLHRFIYGFSNPLSFYDPTGETADEIFDSWLTGIAQEEESIWRETKALAVIGWASVYKFGDMLTYGSAHRISEDTDEYMAGELSTGEYMAEVMGQVAIAGAGTAANIALGAGAIGAVTRAGLTGIGAGIAAGAITGAGGTLIQDVINISQGEQEGLSSLETYAAGTVMGGAMGGIMAGAAKLDARMAQSNRNTPKSTASDEPSTGPAPQSQSDRIRANLEKSRAGRPSEGFKRYATRERARNKLRKTQETRKNSNFKQHTLNEKNSNTKNSNTLSKMAEGSSGSVSRAQMLREKWAGYTPSQRSALLQRKAEANAYRQLRDLENSIPGSHFLEKHGPQTSLQSQLDRVRYYRNPTTQKVTYRNNGSVVKPSSATRYFSYRDQLNAIRRAIHIYKTTGNQAWAEAPVKFSYPIGSGYKRIPEQYGHQFEAKTWFKNGQVNTSFPVWDPQHLHRAF